MKCLDCKFFEKRDLDEFQKKYYPVDGTGFCLRYPAKIEKAANSWCGEFKEKEKK